MLVLLTLAGGLFLSAFFSGSETGFYRVPRVRLLMDAKSGKKTSRWLLWLAGRPTLMVATVLIGNNIANYLVSFGLVLASQSPRRRALLQAAGFAFTVCPAGDN